MHDAEIAIHLREARKLTDHLRARGVKIRGRWNKVSTQNQKMLTERMKEAGFTRPDLFWEHTHEIFRFFDPKVTESWSSVKLWTLLKVPKTSASVDHYGAAESGDYTHFGDRAMHERKKTKQLAQKQSEAEPRMSPEEQERRLAEFRAKMKRRASEAKAQADEEVAAQERRRFREYVKEHRQLGKGQL